MCVEVKEGRDDFGNVGQDEDSVVMEEIVPDFVVHDAVSAEETAREVPDGHFCEGHDMWRSDMAAAVFVRGEGAHVSDNKTSGIGDQVVRGDGLVASGIIEEGD